VKLIKIATGKFLYGLGSLKTKGMTLQTTEESRSLTISRIDPAMEEVTEMVRNDY
jgi:hypothetical protein